MLQLETKKKYARVVGENRKTWLGSEDVLFASVFGTAIYLPFEELLGPILSSAKPLACAQKFPVNAIKTDGEYCAKLWPTFKEIHDYDPNLINTEENLNTEPDGLCIIEDHIIIIEAKRPDAFFNEDQFLKYLKAMSVDKSKNLWLLSVGNGTAVSKEISKFSSINEYNVLYAEWTSILILLKGLLENIPACTKRLFEDLIEVLSNRPLRPFEGFQWPDEVPSMQENLHYKRIVDDEWFPSFPKKWPDSLKELIALGDFLDFSWIK